MTTDALSGVLPPSWNVLDDVSQLLHYDFMRNAFLAGTVVAVVAGAVGYFLVLRALAFAGHALSHIGFAGATGAVVLGVTPIAGLLAFTIGGGAVMGALGRRLRGRDVAIGIVLAWMLGLGVLFLTLYKGYATEAYALLFGQITAISAGDVVVTLIVAAVVLLILGAVARPLLFASLDEDVAEAKGVPTRLLGIGFMMLLAAAVAEAAQVVGILLVFSLLVTPPAIAERLTTLPVRGVMLSVALAVAFTWTGLAIAYWVPHPPSFFITSIAFAAYLSVRGAGLLGDRAAAWRHRRDNARSSASVAENAAIS
jgi:zinc/manganese transport system permease protein